MANKPGEANFFPDVPVYPEMGTFQPVYGKFDLTTYIQGASDYEIMAFLVGKYNACLEAYGTVTKLSTDTITAAHQLQDWINNWFDNLDVQQELNNKVDSMVADGSFGTLLHQTFDAQINQQTTSAVTAWLVANVTPTGSAVVVDKSLSIEGAAADAKSTGKKFESVKLSETGRLEVNVNEPYREYEFTPIVGDECVVCGNGKLSFYVSNPEESSYYVGMLTKRNYLNFDSVGLYLLAFTRPSWEPNGVGLVLSTSTNTLYQVSFNSNTLRVHDINLDSGDKKQLKVYYDYGKIVINIGGVENVIDVTQIPIVPTSPTLGYWSINDIQFGLVFNNEDKQDAPKVFEYTEGKALTKKTVYYALGDSLTAGSYSNLDGSAVAVSDAPWGYPQRIADMLGCEVHNLGIPGGNSALIYTNEVPKVGTDATLITIMTGTNDYSLGSDLGTFEDTEWGTHMGRVYQIVSELIQKCPTARVVLMTPPTSAGDLTREDIATNYRRGTPSSKGWTYDDLTEEYEKFCKKYGIEFINVMWNSPINTFNLWDMLPDATHPTKDAYFPLAQYIYSQLF